MGLTRSMDQLFSQRPLLLLFVLDSPFFPVSTPRSFGVSVFFLGLMRFVRILHRPTIEKSGMKIGNSKGKVVRPNKTVAAGREQT